MNTPITKGFKAIMSKGPDICIEEDEINAVMNTLPTGSFIKVRQGLINPSYLVDVVEDTERRQKFLEDTRHDEQRRLGGMRPLKDIFAKEPFKIAPPPTAGG